MLVGRESLSRVVGKRRRFITRPALLLDSRSSNPSEYNSPSTGDGSESTLMHKRDAPEGSEASDSKCISCPVCGGSIRNESVMINHHLDVCLAKRSKRKLTQRTLMSFGMTPRVGVENDEIDHSCVNVLQNGAKYLHTQNGNFNDSHMESLGEHNHIDQEGPSFSCYPTFKSEHCFQIFECEKANFSGDLLIKDICETSLQTFIVGHKYTEGAAVSGDNIFLERESNNVRDCNAIKVLSSNTGSSKFLGYLPRELSLYLSPLLDKYGMRLEGYITSIPEVLDAIPVQLSLLMPVQDISEGYESLRNLEYLWKNAVAVTESIKATIGTCKYQKNFVLLVQEISKSYAYLLTDDEQNFLELFHKLGDDSQKLFVRLYGRKGPWFRLSNITYTEILDIEKAAQELIEHGFILSLESIVDPLINDVEGVVSVLTVAELKEISNVLIKRRIRGMKKHDIITSLISSYQNNLCALLSLISKRTGTCVKISSTADAQFWRAQRLFFLNGEQDLSAFLLADLGLIKYPAYNCIMKQQVFPSRAELLEYEEAVEVAQLMDESLDNGCSDMILRCIELSCSRIRSQLMKENKNSFNLVPTFFTCFKASWVYSKVITLGVSVLERDHRYSDAIMYLKMLLITFSSDRRRGYWNVRLSINLEHEKCYNESLEIAEKGLMDPWVRAGSKMALQRRVLRLAKPPRRWKTPSFSASVRKEIPEVVICGRPLNCTTGARNRFYGEDGEQCTVEQLALQHYSREGWRGLHSESGIWLTLFALLMWDIIFADIPDVFRNRFQTAPLDLDTDNFYVARKGIIEPHLERICGGMAEEMLITSWELHVGTSCRGVSWDRHSLEELRAAAVCVGGTCLGSLCENLARDYSSWSSGMPDLLLWRFLGDYQGEAKLVEVKGPRDRLSEQQRAWLLLFMDSGFNVEVCKVCPPVENGGFKETPQLSP